MGSPAAPLMGKPPACLIWAALGLKYTTRQLSHKLDVVEAEGAVTFVFRVAF